MAGFFSGVSNTPISTIIFVSEMTNSYHLLLPALLVCSLTYMLSRKWTIYQNQVNSKIDSNAHRGDFFVDILATIRVRELASQFRKAQLIPEDMTLEKFRKVFSESDQQYFPVVDKEKKMIGIFSINDIRGVLFDDEIGDLVRMKDVANSSIIFTTPSEDLNEVFKKCTIRNLHRIPVVSEEDHSVLVGMLDRREMIQYYNQRIEEIKNGKGISTKDLPRKPSDVHLADFRAIPVRDAMNRDIVTVGEATSLEKLIEMIYEVGSDQLSRHRCGRQAQRDSVPVGL